MIGNEIWRPIKEWEAYYEVSSIGNVRSVDRKTTSRPAYGRIISQSTINSGYKSVSLHKNNKSSRFLVHRLVALAFLERSPIKMFVNHKNGIKTDNRLENLEWCTKSENTKHAFETKLMSVTPKMLKRLIKWNTTTHCAPVIQYKKDGSFVAKFKSGREAAAQTGCNYSNIFLCADGHPKHKTCGGFVWKRG